MTAMGISVQAYGSNEVFSITHNGKNNYIEVFTKAGGSGTIEFELSNTSEVQKTNHLLLYDSMTTVNGGNEIMTPENYSMKETAAWFDTNNNEVTLDAGQSESFKIGYKVPEGTRDGVYTAILALYAYSSDTSLGGDEVTLRIDSNYTSTIAVVLRIGKEAEAQFRLGENFGLIVEGSTGNPFMMIPIENAGNSYGFPIIDYVISDEDGLELKSGKFKLDSFYRKTSSQGAIPIEDGLLSKGTYKADVKVLSSSCEDIQDHITYTFMMDNKTMKEVIKGSPEAHGESREEAAWKSDFIVLGKQELILGSTGIIGAVCISAVLIVFLKGRNKN